MTFLDRFCSKIANGRPAILLTICFGLAACFTATQSAVKAAGSKLAEGWSVRADSGTGENNQVAIDGGVYHFMMSGPPSDNGTFYNPAWTAAGNHTVSATFTQNAAATHPTAYGLMFGG